MWIATIVLVSRLSLLGQMGPLAQKLLNDQPTTTASVTTTQPTTQPLNVTLVEQPQKKGILDTFQETEAGRVLSGKEQITLQQVLAVDFWRKMIGELAFAVLGFIPRMLVACLLMFFFWLFYRGIRKVVLGSMTRAHMDQSIRDMLGSLIKWSVLGFGLVSACSQIGLDITALLTGVSIIGLAIGFAAQETLANFIAGVVIFWDRPFKVGDWVTVDATFSQVQRVTFRSTRLLTLDGQTVVFPNTFMLANKVLNHSAHPINRINIPVGIAYAASIDDARAALLALTTHDSRVVTDPPPAVVVDKLADSSVNLILRFWIRDESQEQAMFFEYSEKVKKALDAANIEIPFPHVQLMLEQTEAVKTLAGKDTKAA